MAFDPEEYLKQVEPKQAAFDPVAYLQQVEATPASVSSPLSTSDTSVPPSQPTITQADTAQPPTPAPLDFRAAHQKEIADYESRVAAQTPEEREEVNQIENPTLLHIPKLQGNGVGAGIARGLASGVEGLTSPGNIALMATLGGAPGAIQKAAALGFTAMMAKDVPDKIIAGKQAYDAGNHGDAVEAWTGAAIDTLLTALTIGHSAARGEGSPAFLKTKEALRSKGLTQEQVDAAFQRIKDADPNALKNASDQAIDALVKDPSLRKTLPYSEQEIEAEVARRASLPPKVPAPVQPQVKTFLRGQEVGSTPTAPATAETGAEPPLASQPTPGDVQASSVPNTGRSKLFQLAQREEQASQAVAPLKVAAEAAKEVAPAAAAAAEQSAEELKAKALETQPEPGTKIVGPAITDEQGNILSQGEIGTNHGQLKTGEIAKGNVEAADASHSFVDDKGNVLNREQAWELAKKAGQIPKETLDAQARGEIGPELHSEHLSEGAKPKSQLTERLSGLLDEHERNLADDEPAAPVPEPAPDTSAQETGSEPKSFAQEVEQAAANTRASKVGWFGPRKILINKAWEAWQNKTGKTMSLEDFKRELLNSQRNMGVELSRADYPVGVDKGDLAASHTKYGDEDYHFITTDKEAAPVEPKKTPSKEETITALKGELEQAIKDKRTRDTGPLRKRIKALESEPKEAETQATPEPEPEKPKEIWEKTREQAKAEGILAKHRLAVKAAVAEGKPVPLEVLEDFGGSPWAEKAIEKNYGGKASDSLLSKIEKALEDDPTKLFADPLLVQTVGKPVLRQAVKVIRASLEAGKLIGDAVEDAITYLKTQNPNVDEEKARTLFGNLVEQPETKGGEISEERNQIRNEEKGDEGEVTPPGEGESVPSQSPDPEIPYDAKGIQNAITEALRDKHGFEERSKVLTRTFGSILEGAKDTLKADEEAGNKLVDDLSKKIRPLDDKEDALLTLELANRQTAFEKAEAANNLDTADKTETGKALDLARDRLFKILGVAENVGTENARGLNARKLLIKKDFSLAGILRKEMSARGRELTPKEQEQVVAQAKEIERLQKELSEKTEALKNATEDKSVKEAYEATIRDLKKKLAKAESKSGKPLSKTIIEKVDSAIEAAKKRIKERKGKLFADPLGVMTALDFADYTIIGAGHIVKGAVVFTKWSSAMVKDLGEEIKPHLKTLYDASKEKAKTLVGDVSKEREQTSLEARARVKADAVAGDELSHKAVYDLARSHIEAGVHGEDAVMKAVHNDVKEAYPNATERDVRRAFSEYGKVKFPSKDAVDTELRELRRLTGLQESIDRETAGMDALHSGLQRDKATQSIRDKQKQLNELLKKREGPPSPAKLASRDEAKQTSLKNAMADLDRQLRTGEKPVRSSAAPDSSATEQLRAERDAMREKLSEIEEDANPGKSEDQVKLESLQKRIAEAKEKITSGNVVKAGKPTVDTQDVAAAKRELAELNKQMQEMRRDTPKTDAEKQIEKLSAIKQRLDDTLTGKLDPNTPKDFKALSQAAEDIKAETLAMQELLAQIRRDEKPKGDPGRAKEQAQIKALEEAIDRYTKKTADKDFTVKGKTLGPDSKEVANLKEIRDSRRSMYDAVKKASKPVRTPDEIYNERRLKDIKKQIAELDTKKAKGDFEPVVKPKTARVKTDEVTKAEADLASKKKEIKEGWNKIQYERRSTPQKAVDAVKNALRFVTAVKVIGHGTVGMITHAGGLIWRPSSAVTWARNFGRQFGLWTNKAYHERLIYALKNDPEFEMWKNAGASIDPEKTYTDYGLYAKWLGKLTAGGERGFDALKLTRLELNKADWKNVSPEIKANPEQAAEMQKAIAAMNNKATGAIPKVSPITEQGARNALEAGAYNLAKNPISDAVFFAPKLYASRWMRVVYDPVKTAGTFLNWKDASPAERQAATVRAKHAAEFAATYVGALLVNQGILSATGSQQKVNITDPTKKDWLKFKGAGKEVVADGGLLDPVRLLGQIVWGDLLNSRTASERYRDGSRLQKVTKDLGSYVRGKLNPTLGLMVDASTGEDFQGRPLPFSDEPARFPDQPKYTWGEWLMQQGPIPLSGGIKIAYDEMRKNGMSHLEAMAILKGAAVSVAGMTGAHVSDEPPPKTKSKKTRYSAIR